MPGIEPVLKFPYLFLDDRDQGNVGVLINTNCNHVNYKCLMPGCNSKHKKSPFNLIVKEIDINSFIIGNEGSILIFNKFDEEYFNELILTAESRQIYRINYSDSTGKYWIFGKGLIFLNLIYTMDFDFDFNNYIYNYTNPTECNVTLFKQRFDNPTRRNNNAKHDNYPKEYLRQITSLSTSTLHDYQPDVSVLEEDLVEIPDDDDDMELSFNPIFIPINVPSPISTPEVIVIDDDESEEDIVLYESQIILQTPNYSVSLKKRIKNIGESTGSPKKSKQ